MSGLSRRGFIQSSAAIGAFAANASANAPGKVLGANDTVRVGFIGVGGRCQSHVDRVLDMARDKHKIQAVAVCDVFNRHRDETAEKIDKRNAEMGIHEKCVKFADYRELLADPNIDVVCIATPDHWHAKMTIDAFEAGKHVYCEKPMTHTIDEAYAVVDAAKKTGKVMQVGVQSTSDPMWRDAHAKIIEGRIGKVVQAQTHYYRNSSLGQWRYYRLTKDMTPKNVDWDMFLGAEFGLAPKVPFDRARYFQWRCYWDYGGGMFTDLFVHRTTRFMIAMGVREPRRVVGAGGLYLEYDGRDVPDVATVVADFNEGCQLIVTATMVNDHAIEECIRGHNATIVFNEGVGYDIINQKFADRPTNSAERSASAEVERVVPPGIPTGRGDVQTRRHWENFIDCVRRGDRNTNNTPELGAAAICLVNMGTQSYRDGTALFWDADRRKVVNADASWAKGWEKRSHNREKPVHVMGWKAGDTGSLLTPPEYQKLEGPWINGADPAGEA
jgi:predicted dehydrogenase